MTLETAKTALTDALIPLAKVEGTDDFYVTAHKLSNGAFFVDGMDTILTEEDENTLTPLVETFMKAAGAWNGEWNICFSIDKEEDDEWDLGASGTKLVEAEFTIC